MANILAYGQQKGCPVANCRQDSLSMIMAPYGLVQNLEEGRGDSGSLIAGAGEDGRVGIVAGLRRGIGSHVPRRFIRRRDSSFATSCPG